MSHALALVILEKPEASISSGPEHWIRNQLDIVTYPYWELDMSQEDARDDPRSVFEVQIVGNKLQEEHRAWLKNNAMHTDIEEYLDEHEWVRDYHGYIYDEEKEAYGYWYNPDSKWDWFALGGRWSGEIRGSDGECHNYLQIKDIDPDWLHYSSSFSVITKDGQWREKAQLGWFGATILNIDDKTCIEEDVIPEERIQAHLKSEYLPGYPTYGEKDIQNITNLLNEFFSYDPEKKEYSLAGKIYPNQLLADAAQRDAAEGVEGHSSGSAQRRLYRFFSLIYDILWEQNFYKDFIEPLDPEDWLVVVDYHI